MVFLIRNRAPRTVPFLCILTQTSATNIILHPSEVGSFMTSDSTLEDPRLVPSNVIDNALKSKDTCRTKCYAHAHPSRTKIRQNTRLPRPAIRASTRLLKTSLLIALHSSLQRTDQSELIDQDLQFPKCHYRSVCSDLFARTLASGVGGISNWQRIYFVPYIWLRAELFLKWSPYYSKT